MSRVIFACLLAAAGAAAAAADTDVESRRIPGNIKADSGDMMRASVTSVVTVRRGSDGTLEQRCDVIPAERVEGLSEPARVEWIRLPEERVR